MPDIAIPRVQAPIASQGGLVTQEWHTFFLLLRDAAGGDTDLQAQIDALAAKVAALPSGGGSATFSLRGVGSVQIEGSPAAGAVQIMLDGDTDSPGNTWYYGTAPDGSRGWWALSDGLAVSSGELTKAVGSDGVTTFGLADLDNSGGGALVKIARDAKGRVSGTSSATTDDLTQGATNKYFPEAPTDGYPYVRRSGTWEQTNSPSARYWLIEYPFLTDQAGNQLTDQAGNLLFANSPIIPPGWPTQTTTTVAATTTLQAMTLAQANALANPQDFQMVAIVDLTGGREPCWYDASVGSGTKWRRFSDRSIAS
ncbi:hypothetical protein ACM9XA_11225 [Xanthomonas sacchari]